MKRIIALGGLMVLAVAFAAVLAGIPKQVQDFAMWPKVVTQGLPASGPHAGQGKLVFANPAAAKDWKTSAKTLPVGSIIVKTAGSTDAPTLIATMEKKASGWYYEEYFPEAGKYVLKFGGPNGQALCVNCHTGAKAKDYLFSRP